MLTALDAHYPSPRQPERVGDANVTTRKEPDTPRSRIQMAGNNATLIGGVAHDFNNVLNSILMSARLLQMSRPEEEKHRLLNIIQASAERGAAIVNGLLALADQVDGPTDPCLDSFFRAG